MIVDRGAPNDLVLSATVDPENAFGESDETNNAKSETTTVSGDVCTSTPCVDLVVAQVLDNPDPVANGGTITYTASVVNVGDTAVNPSAIWALDITYTGSGSPVLTFPPGIGLCAVVPPTGRPPRPLHEYGRGRRHGPRSRSWVPVHGDGDRRDAGHVAP